MPDIPADDRRAVVSDVPPLNRVRVAIEIAVGFAALLLIDRTAFGGTCFAGVEPHPFWLLVLAAATVYGSTTGFIVAAIASALWFFAPHAEFAPGQNYYAYLLDRTALPLLWILTALVIGEIAAVRARRLTGVIAQARALSGQTDTLATRYRALSALNRDLQVSIATEERTASRLLALSARLAAPAPDAIGPAVEAMIAAAGGSASFVVYLLDRDDLVPAIVALAPAAIVPDLRGSPLLTAVVRENRLIHVGNPRGRTLLAGAGMLALPIRHGVDGAGIGLVLFTDVPLAAFTEVGVNRFAAMSGWLSEVAVMRYDALIRLAVPLPAPVLSIVSGQPPS